MFIAGYSEKKAFICYFLQLFTFFSILLLKFVTRLTIQSKRAFLICKLRMRRMIENDTDLLKCYTRKAVIGAGTG